MKILIFEAFDGGHYQNYIVHILTKMSKLVEQKIADSVIFCITQRNYEQIQKERIFEEVAKYIIFDTSLVKVNQEFSLSNKKLLADNFLKAIKTYQPDYVVSTTADNESLFLAMKNTLRQKTFPKNIFCLGIFHYGYSGAVSKTSDYLKDVVYNFVWKRSGYSRLMMVNPLVYESLIKNSDKKFKTKIRLLPDPVPQSVYYDKESARKILNIPLKGVYFGYIGQMDKRKAIPELLTAWKDSGLSSENYLLLAGRLDSSYKYLVMNKYQDLVEKGRIIVIDRHLNDNELIAGYCALDVVTILSYKRPNLSANLLKAIACKRPIVADDYGYTGFMVKEFNIGYSCNIQEKEALISVLNKASKESQEYIFNEKTKRLMDFHNPENYVNTILDNLEGLLPLKDKPELKTWEWVCNS
jgi:glycosyltransferase involved in cell wall biosynthesis